MSDNAINSRLCCCKVEMSFGVQSVIVILGPSQPGGGNVRNRGVWRFPGLWEGWEAGQSYGPVSQAFHQAGISIAAGVRSES